MVDAETGSAAGQPDDERILLAEKLSAASRILQLMSQRLRADDRLSHGQTQVLILQIDLLLAQLGVHAAQCSVDEPNIVDQKIAAGVAHMRQLNRGYQVGRQLRNDRPVTDPRVDGG